MSRRPLALVGLASLALLLALTGCNEMGTIPEPPPELDSPSLLGSTYGSQNYVHVFERRGTFDYHCAYHTNAHYREPGSVIVADTGADSAFVAIFQGAYQPATVTIRLGGQVRWQNFDDGVHHTVTSD